MLVKISGEKCIREYTPIEAEKIKLDLTFVNKEYTNAKLFSRYPTTNIPENIYYYKEENKVLSVPRGYKLIFPHEIVDTNCLTFGNISYPKFKLKLRNIQQEAATSYLKRDEDGVVVMQTGSGKSILGLYIASILKERVLIVAHKEDILDGWEKDAQDCFGDIEVGLIKGKKFSFGEQITLTTIQTLSKLGQDKIDEINKNISMIICDECHRVGSNSYKVINNLVAKYRLGLTATDIRNDGLRDVLDLILGTVVYRFQEGESDDILNSDEVKVLIKNTDVTWKEGTEFYYVDTLKYVKDFTLADENKVIKKYSKEWFTVCNKLVANGRIKRKIIDIQEAFQRIRTDEHFNELVLRDIIKESTNGNPCLVLCREKEQIRKLDLLLNREKIRDNILYYGDSNIPKGEMKEIAESRKSLITLATLAIATEGTNVKAWSRIFLVSSIANEKDLIQAIGRGRRKEERKKDLVIYDYRHPKVDGVCKHGEVRDKLYKKLNFSIDRV